MKRVVGFFQNAVAAETTVSEKPAYVPKQSPSLLDLSGGDVADAQDDEPVSGRGAGGASIRSSSSAYARNASSDATGPKTQLLSGYIRKNGTAVHSYTRSR